LCDTRHIPLVAAIYCNKTEAADFTGKARIDDQLKMLQFNGLVETAVVTAGADGIYARREGENYKVPAFSDGRGCLDDTGAGDAAQTAITDAFIRGEPLDIALRLGARNGYEACTAVGATTNLLDHARMFEYRSELDQSSRVRHAGTGPRLVIGGLCLDIQRSVRKIRERTFRIISKWNNAGAGATNSAIAHRLLAPEGRIILFAMTGNDRNGKTVRCMIEGYNIEMPLDPLMKVETSFSEIFIDESGAGTIHSYAGAREVEIPMHVIEKYMPGAKACCIVS